MADLRLLIEIDAHDDRVEAPEGVVPQVIVKSHPIVAGIRGGGRCSATIG